MEDIDRESLEALPIQDPDEEQRSYTPREIQLRDRFAKEYLLDYDPIGAAVRVGYNRGIAKEYAQRFMEEPYVERKIKQLESAPETEEEESVVRKRIIAGLNREANYFGPGSSAASRVAALGKLAQLKGMEPVKQTKTELTGPEGSPLAGTFVLPGIMDPEQWEKAAAQQQADLVSGKTAQVKQVEAPVVD